MLDDLQINTDRIPLYKIILHVLQILLSFVSWCLEIVVFRSKDASVNGQNGWAFAVVRQANETRKGAAAAAWSCGPHRIMSERSKEK